MTSRVLGFFCTRGPAAGVVLATLLFLGSSAEVAHAAAGPFVRLETDAGKILVYLDRDLAPNHVNQFVRLSETGFYDGTSFHRIVPGFVIQGGDPQSKDGDPNNDGQGFPGWQDVLSGEEYAQVEAVNRMLAEKGYTALPDRATLRQEFSRTAKHVRGSLSMARAQAVDSAGSQFFVCVAATPQLDGSYTLFGRVVSGMDVVDSIVSAPTSGRERPIQPVRIRSAEVLANGDLLTPEELAAWQSGSAGSP